MSILAEKKEPLPAQQDPGNERASDTLNPPSATRRRRSGIDRRWIKTPYNGPERRRVRDRRDSDRPTGDSTIAYRFKIKLSPVHLKPNGTTSGPEAQEPGS
ncbi:MAG: hypothetical protein WBG37_12495 [Desulfobacterales bacterium]